jgi:hypothetical protein
METNQKTNSTQEWFPELYREKVRSQRTRRCVIDVPAKENDPQIQHTLLGIELKVGRKRFSCPDLPTARYFRIFAKIGCKEFAIPYDITKISAVADELESSLERALLSFKSDAAKRSKTLRQIRSEIQSIGSGDDVPTFKKTIKGKRG